MAVTRPFFACALAALAFAALMCGPVRTACAEDADAVVARVNGVDIHESDIAFAAEEIGGNMPSMAPAQKRDYIITYLTDVVVVAQAAEQQKLQDRPEIKRRLAFDHNRLLMDALLQQVGKAALTDEELHKVYDAAIKDVKSEEEVHARHILVATEDEAKAVLAELKNGGDFAKLAKEKSKDPGGAEGGDLGWFTKEQMVPEFAEAAFKLKKGELSEPIKTKFGWHIIQVEDRRIKPVPTFEQVKGQIETYVAHRAQAALVQKLRSAANVERFDKPVAADPGLNPAAPSKK